MSLSTAFYRSVLINDSGTYAEDSRLNIYDENVIAEGQSAIPKIVGSTRYASVGVTLVDMF